MTDIEDVDLTPIVIEHFVDGDELEADIAGDTVTVYRKRGDGEWQVVATVKRPSPSSLVYVDWFSSSGFGALDDFGDKPQVEDWRRWLKG